MLRNKAVGRRAVSALVFTDSVLLLCRVVMRRTRRTIISGRVRSSPVSARPPVLYLDCGVHKKGEQIRWMRQWFGDRYELEVLAFEAGSEHVSDASAALADLGVKVHHVALVGPDHVGDEVRLHKGGGGGKGDSLFAARGDDFEVVPARRLSQLLADGGYDLDKIPVILRMNIEGAEQFVIDDLLDAGLEQSIDGYYGMWDDLSKIDPAADARFRTLLTSHGISPVTFNDRDLHFTLRRYAIRYDIETSIRTGLARVGRRGIGLRR